MASGKTVAHFKVEMEQLFSNFAKANVVTDQLDKSLKKLAADGAARADKSVVTLTKSFGQTVIALKQMNATTLSAAQRLKYLGTATDTVQRRIRVMREHVDRKTNSLRAMNSVLAASATRMQQTGGSIRKTADETKKATTATKGLLLSWQSLVRLLTIQVLHQAVSLMSMALRRAADDASKLQLKLAEVRAISDGVFLSINDWGSGLRAVSERWGTDILQTTEAAYQTVSNQIAQGTDAIKFVESASRLAMAAVGTQTDAVNALSSVINAYKLNVEETDSVSAKLFETIKLGRLRLVNLGQDLGQVTPIAAQLGVSIDELLGAIASLTRLGMSSSEAVTQMRNVFLRLLRPTDEMRDLISDLGFASGAAMIKTLGLAGAFEAMQKRARGSIDVLTDLNPRIRGMAATMEFTERRGLHRLQTYIKAIEESADSYIQRAEEIMDTDAKKWERSTSAIKNYFLLDVGPALLKMLVAINGESNRLTDTIKALTVVISVGLVGALGYALVKLALLAAAFPVVTVAAYAIAIGLGLVIEALDLQKKVLDSNMQTWLFWGNALHKVNNELIHQIEEGVALLDQQIDASFESVSSRLKKTSEVTLGNIEELVKGYSAYFNDALKSVEESIKDITKEIENLQKAQEKVEGFVKGFHLDAEKQMFQFLLDDADAVAKFDLWQNRIKVLGEQQRMAMEAGDSDEVARIGKEINAAHVQLKTLQDNLADNDIRKAKDVATAYWEANRNTIEMLTKLKEQMHQEELKRINDLAEAERRQDRITALMKRTEQLSVIDMMKKDMPQDPRMRQLYLQDLKGMFGQYMSAIDQIRDISGKPVPEELSGMGKQMSDYIKQQEQAHQNMLLQERNKDLLNDYAIDMANATQIQKETADSVSKLDRELIDLRREAERLNTEWKKFENLPWIHRGGEFAKKEVERRDALEKSLKEQIDANNVLLEEKTKEHAQLKDENLKRAAAVKAMEEQYRVMTGLVETGNAEREKTIKSFEELNKSINAIVKSLGESVKAMDAVTEEAAKPERKPSNIIEVDGKVFTPAGDAATGKAFGGPTYGSESKFMTPGEMIMSADSTRKFFNQYMTGNSNVASASGSNVNIGDINVTMQAHGNVNYDAQRLGNQIRREIRQGMLVL